MQFRLKIPNIRYLPPKNLSRINRSLFGIMAGMLVYGMLLPNDWEQSFGIFAQPIIWAANNVPSIGKFAAASTIPEFITGFVGFAAYIPPLYAVYLIRWGFFDCSEDNGVRLILNPPNHPLVIWMFLLMFGVFFLCYFYVTPFFVDSIRDGVSSGSRIGARMLESPFSLVFNGSILTAVLGGILACSIGCIIRAFGLLIQGDDENGNNDK